MDSFDQALQVIAGIMRDGIAKHPDFTNGQARPTGAVCGYYMDKAQSPARGVASLTWRTILNCAGPSACAA